MRRTKADAEATRQKILSAAERVFYAKGVSNTTLEDVAKEAGVTRGAIYWHFSNKTDLFLALHDAVPLPQEDMIAQEIEAETADTLAIVEDAMGAWIDILAADEQRQRILTIMLRTNYDGDMSEVLTRHRDLDEHHNALLELAFARALASGYMRDSWTPTSATRTLHWMMLGLCTQWLLFGRSFDIVAEGRDGLRRLFSSFRTPRAARTPPTPLS
jgi:AcrR family transcriptional regulator